MCSSLGSSSIVQKNNNAVRFVQQDRAPVSKKENPLGYVLIQSETPIATSSKKSVRVPVNESIEYEAPSSYGFEGESRKRRLNGNNCKAKKHCADISITDLFGDQR